MEMMESLPFITFIVASITLIAVPGPNVIVVVSTSVYHGTIRGLQTVLGTSSAMVIQLTVAAIGTTWFVDLTAEGLEWLRWLGVAYLIYLGVTHLSGLVKNENKEKEKVTGKGTFSRGFIVSLTNPKTILFFGAFFPQFISPDKEYMDQIMILSMTFLILATLLDSLYAITAGHLRYLIRGSRAQRIQDGVSGLLFIGAGVWLAAMRKS